MPKLHVYILIQRYNQFIDALLHISLGECYSLTSDTILQINKINEILARNILSWYPWLFNNTKYRPYLQKLFRLNYV